VSVLYSYSADVRAWTLDATLVIAVTFLGSTIAATILPWWKPQLFDNSPIARLKVPITVASLIISVILAYTIYLWLTDPLYGIGVGNAESIKFLGVLYGAAAVLYIVARLYRRSQGVDLDAIHAEIPAE
jgi:basic amino acid/polyamine antiporter, APA family